MQTYTVARDRVLAYCKQYAPQDLAAVENAYSGLARLERLQSDPGFDDAAKKADTVIALLESRREALAKASSPKAFRDALQMARIVSQATHMRASASSPSYRDEMMARNTRWLLDEAHPSEKIVLWAHNGHISTARTSGERPMGSWLRESLGPQMYVLGFAIHTGAVRAVTRENNRGVGLTASQIPPAPPGTGTATLSAAGHPLFFLDMKKQSGLLGKWLFERHQFRACGAVWDRSNPDSSLISEALGKSYDGLIYLENTQAARGISR
jgi:erythromycin esterase